MDVGLKVQKKASSKNNVLRLVSLSFIIILFLFGTGVSFAGSSASATNTFGVNALLTSLSTTGATIDNGQSNTITASWTGGTSNFAITLFSGTLSTCSSDTTVANTASGVSGHSTTFVVSPTSNTYYCIGVKDSASTANTANQVTAVQIVVNAAPSISQPTPTSAKVDVGQTQTITATITGGTPNYVGNAIVTKVGVITNTIAVPSQAGTSLTSTWTTASNEIGTETANYVMKDSLSTSFNSVPSTSWTVYNTLSTLTTTGATIDNGQSNTITANWIGGAPNFAVTLFSGSSATCSSDTTVANTASGVSGQSTTFVVSPTSSTYYCIGVKDSASTAVSANQVTAVQIVVNAVPSVSQPTPTSAKVDVGQTQTITATITGGTPNYVGNAIITKAGVPTNTIAVPSQAGTALSSTWTTASNEIGTETGNFVMKDSLSTSFNSVPSTSWTVYNTLSTLTTTGATIDNGQSNTITANWIGGAPNFAVTLFSGSSATCSSDTTVANTASGVSGQSTTFVVSPTSSTYYCIGVKDSASTAVSANQVTAVQIVVNAVPSVSQPTPTSAKVDVGQTQTITATITGGTPNYVGNAIITKAGVPTNTIAVPSQAGTALSSTWTTASNEIGTETGNFVMKDSLSTSFNSVPSTSWTVYNTLSTLTTTGATIDNGQSNTITANWIGGAPNFAVTLFSGSSSTCSSDTTVANTASGVSGQSTTFVVSPTSSTYYCIGVKDSASTAVSANQVTAVQIVVNAVPSVSQPTPTSAKVDVGQTQTITATITGGTPNYVGNAIITKAGVPTNTIAVPSQAGTALSSTWTTASNEIGTETGNFVMKDSLSTSFNSVPSTSWTVYNTLSTLTTTGATINNGQSNTITANWIGGAPNFVVTLFSGSSSTCSSDTTVANTASGVSGQSTTFVVTPSSSTYYCIGVKDSASTAVSANQVTAVQIVVNAGPSISQPTPTSSKVDVGQTQTISATITGGTPNYVGNAIITNSGATTNTIAVPSQAGTALSSTWTTASNEIGTETGNFVMKDSLSTSFNSVPSTSWTVYNTLSTLTTTGATIDNGQSNTITANWIGGAPNFAVTLFSGSSATCSSDTTVVTTTSGVSGQSTTFSISPTSNTYYCIGVKDSATSAVSANQVTAMQITVNAAPSISQPTPTAAKVDVGQTQTISATITGGTPNYVGNAIVTNSGATTNTIAVLSQAGTALSSTWTTASNEIGTETGNFVMKDAFPVSFNSVPSTSWTVYNTLSTLTTTGATIDNGQSNTITANWIGGAPNFTVTLFSGSSATCSSDTTVANTASGVSGQSTTFVVSPTSSTYYCIGVKDSASTAVSANQVTAVQIVVNAVPSVSQPTPTSAKVDVGQTQTITATITGGTPNYVGNAIITKAGVPTNTIAVPSQAGTSLSSTWTTASNEIGTETGNFVMKDSLSTSFNSIPSTSWTVYNTLSTLTTTGATIDNGQSNTITANWIGGAPNFAVTLFSGSSATCSSDTTVANTASGVSGQSTTFVVSPTSSTYYCIGVKDSASTAVSANQVTAVQIVVNAVPSVSQPTPTSAKVDVGQTQTITATITGGTPNYVGNAIITKAGVPTNTIAVPSQAGTSLSSTWTTASNEIGTETGNFVMKDSLSTSFNSIPSTSWTVYNTLSTLTTTGATIDNGQSNTITANWIGGAPNFAVTLFSGSSSTCSSDTTVANTASGVSGQSTTFVVSPTSSTYYCIGVKDSASTAVSANQVTAVQIVVNAVPSVSQPTPTSAKVDVGQTQTITATITGGTPNYVGNAIITNSGATTNTIAVPSQAGTSLSSTWTTASNEIGTETGNFVMKDSLSTSFNSIPSTSWTVYNTLSTLTTTGATIDNGQSPTR